MDHVVGVGLLGDPLRHLVCLAETHVGDDRPSHLEEDRRLGLLGRPHERLGRLLVVHVEGTDGVAAVNRLLDDLPGVDLSHDVLLRRVAGGQSVSM